MPPHEPDVVAVVENLLNTDGAAIVDAGARGDISRDAFDAAQDTVGALRDVLATGRQLEGDLAELHAKRDLMPRSGYERLVDEAKRDAREKSKGAQQAAERSYARLEQLLRDETLPRLDERREQLARDEAALAISSGNPEGSAYELAHKGNDEALAALLTPWGRTLLAARGVRDVDRVLTQVRRAAAAYRIPEAAVPAARLLRDHLGGLGAAKGSAGWKVRDRR